MASLGAAVIVTGKKMMMMMVAAVMIRISAVANIGSRSCTRVQRVASLLIQRVASLLILIPSHRCMTTLTDLQNGCGCLNRPLFDRHWSGCACGLAGASCCHLRRRAYSMSLLTTTLTLPRVTILNAGACCCSNCSL